MIALTIEGDVAIVTIDRAAARNAIPIAGWDRLAEAVADGAAQARAVLLRSALQGCFCAGADLSEFPAMMADPTLPPLFRAAMARATDALTNAAVPVIAAIDGACFGAGVALMLACDVRVAGPAAAFAIPPARLGIAYPQGDIDRLRALVGAGQASRLLLTGDRIDRAEALRIRLVEIGSDDAGAAARQVAERIAANVPASIAVLRAGLRGQAAAMTDGAFDALFAGADLRERLTRR